MIFLIFSSRPVFLNPISDSGSIRRWDAILKLSEKWDKHHSPSPHLHLTPQLLLLYYTAVNGHLELPLLKDRQRFGAVSTSNLEVYKFRDWWILTYFIFGHGDLHLIIFEAWWNLTERAFYCFIIFFVWKGILT